MAVRRAFTLAILGTSLTTGRLSADWVPTLLRELECFPEAKGPIEIYNLGKGSQTSTSWLVPQAPVISALKPNHILTEGFAINDCVDTGSGPAVTRSQHSTNIQNAVTAWKAAIPGVDITLQTMNPVSTPNVTQRPTLADYYADEVTLASMLSIRSLDNYAGWPKPLPQYLTDGGATQIYAPPTGFSSWDTGTFNSAAKGAAMTLSQADQRATAAGLHTPVRGTAGMSAGKKYFEVRAFAGTSTGSVVGIVPASASMANGAYIGSTSGAYGYYYNGNLLTGGSSASLGAAWTDGDIIGVAVDFTANKIWWSKNGAWQNGDPAAGTGGRAFTAGTYYPAISTGDGGAMDGFFPNFPGDGLHPVWAGAVDTYLYPAILTWARARMAAFWP